MEAAHRKKKIKIECLVYERQKWEKSCPLSLVGIFLRIENKTTCCFRRVVFEEKSTAWNLQGIIFSFSLGLLRLFQTYFKGLFLMFKQSVALWFLLCCLCYCIGSQNSIVMMSCQPLVLFFPHKFSKGLSSYHITFFSLLLQFWLWGGDFCFCLLVWGFMRSEGRCLQFFPSAVLF